MNFNLYIFGNPCDGVYEQYPDDYSIDILKRYAEDLNHEKKMIIHRDGDIVYYSFVTQLTTSKYIGYCIAVNGTQLLDFQKLSRMFENVTKYKLLDANIYNGTDFVYHHFSQNIDGFGKIKDELCSWLRLSNFKHRTFSTYFSPAKNIAIVLPYNTSNSRIAALCDEYNTIVLEESIGMLRDDGSVTKNECKIYPKKIHIIYVTIIVLLCGFLLYGVYNLKKDYECDVVRLNSIISDINKQKDDIENELSQLKKNPNKLIEYDRDEPLILLFIDVKKYGSDYGKEIKKAKILYCKLSIFGLQTKTISLKVKLYENGVLSTGGGSWYREGYTFDMKVNLKVNCCKEYEHDGGWLHLDGSRWNPGDYRYEVWYEDMCLGVKEFSVY